MALALRWPLRIVLLDLQDRKEVSRLYRPDAILSDNANNEHLHDLKRRDAFPSRRERWSRHVSDLGEGTGRGIANFGINGFDGCFRIAVIESDEAFYLLLSVAYQGGPDLNIGSLRWQQLH